MAKRFADTNKYKKAFIMGLPAAYKILWDFICLDCDFAGIWHKNFAIAQIYIGEDAKVDEAKALELFNKDEQRIVVLNHGSKWWIKPFVEFQYGRLNPANRTHLAVINLLLKDDLIKGLVSPLQEAKDKDKDKDKDMDKDKDKDRATQTRPPKTRYLDFVLLTADEMKKLTDQFGEKKTSDFISRLNDYIGSKGDKYKSHYHTIMNWARRDFTIEPKKGVIPEL